MKLFDAIFSLTSWGRDYISKQYDETKDVINRTQSDLIFHQEYGTRFWLDHIDNKITFTFRYHRETTTSLRNGVEILAMIRPALEETIAKHNEKENIWHMKGKTGHDLAVGK